MWAEQMVVEMVLSKAAEMAETLVEMRVCEKVGLKVVEKAF